MADVARFPCLMCAGPFDTRAELEEHRRAEGHTEADVAALAIARARGDAPHTEVEDRRLDMTPLANAARQRRRLRVIDGGRR